jgi:acyl-coenzyme A synthetase/AMP-(fatty) acid ligase
MRPVDMSMDSGGPGWILWALYIIFGALVNSASPVVSTEAGQWCTRKEIP